MDKNVIVSVSGMLFAQGKGGESEDVEVISPGEYHWKNGKHYIRYVEINEEFEEPIMNTLKISPDEVSIMKRGLIESTMVFNRGNFTASHYTTPFGTLVMGIRTKDMKVSEEEAERFGFMWIMSLRLTMNTPATARFRLIFSPAGNSSAYRKSGGWM